MNFQPKTCSTLVKQLSKVAPVFCRFIKTVRVYSDIWLAKATLPATSEVKNSKQTMLHF